MSDWTRRVALRCLEGPITHDEALALGMGIVPPGQAYRAGERNRQYKMETEQRITDRKVKAPRYLDEDEERLVRIRAGAKEIVRSSLWTATKYGRLEIYYEDGVKMIRLGPTPWRRDQLV